MKKSALYIVLALAPGNRRWVEVTKTPLGRPDAAHLVAAEWSKGHYARAIPLKP